MSGSNGGGMFVVENYGWLKILVKMCLCLSSLKSQENKINVHAKMNTVIARLSELGSRGTQPAHQKRLFTDHYGVKNRRKKENSSYLGTLGAVELVDQLLLE